MSKDLSYDDACLGYLHAKAAVLKHANDIAYQAVHAASLQHPSSELTLDRLGNYNAIQTTLEESLLPAAAWSDITAYLVTCEVDPDAISPMRWAQRVRDFVDGELRDMIRAELPFVLRRLHDDLARAQTQTADPADDDKPDDNKAVVPLAVGDTAYMLVSANNLVIGTEVIITAIFPDGNGRDYYHVRSAADKQVTSRDSLTRSMLWAESDDPSMDPRPAF